MGCEGDILANLNRFFRKLKDSIPYIRRRRYRDLESLYEQLIKVVQNHSLQRGGLGASHAAMATVLDTPFERRDVCFFVTYAPHARLKFHVLHHMKAFKASGFDVVLIVNTNHGVDQFNFPSDIDGLCKKVFVRQNIGFDFAAWAHAFLAIHLDLGQIDRIVLANDSLIGPLDLDCFDRIIERFRSSHADVFGLTENPGPRWHLQSFFLGFQRQALEGSVMHDMMGSILNLPTKELVIELYETRLSLMLKEKGLRLESMFPNMSDGVRHTNDTYYRWADLIKAGFPYLKISVLSEQLNQPEVRQAVPADLLGPWLQEQGKS